MKRVRLLLKNRIVGELAVEPTANGEGVIKGARSTARRVCIGAAVVALLVLALLVDTNDTHAADFTISSNTNWSAIVGGPPTSADTITITNGATLTVDVSTAVCASIQIGPTAGSDTGTLGFSSGTDQVTVSGTVTVGGSGGGAGSINMGSGGTLIAPVLAVNTAGTWTPGSGTVRLTASNTIPIAFFTSFNNLTINGGTTTLGANLPITGDLSVSAGTLDLSTFTANRSASGGTLTVSNGATLEIGGTNTFPTNYTTHTLGATSTVEYSGAAQSISSETYGNLQFTAAGNKTMGSGTTTIAGTFTNSAGTMMPGTETVVFTGASGAIAGGNEKNFFNLQINSGASITQVASTGNVTINGNYTNDGTFSQDTSRSTTFGGTASLSGSGTTTFGSVTVQGSSTTNAASHNFTMAGTFSVSSGGTFNGGTATVTFAGSSVMGSGVGTYNFFNVTISGTLTNNKSFAVKGTWTNNGSYTKGTDTITFNGSSAQTIGGSVATAFSGLTINNAAGVTLNTTTDLGGSVTGVLTLTTDLTVDSAEFLTQSGTSAGTGDVIGAVQRNLSASVAGSFGNTNVQVTNNTAITLKVLLVKASPSSFSASVQRTYTLTGGSADTATLQFRYRDSELNMNTDTSLTLYRAQGTPATWVDNGTGDLSRNTGPGENNWIKQTGITAFSSWTLANGGQSPTAIDMASYSANRLGKGKVLLEWETGYEVDNLGFNIYRQESGERVRVNKSMIAGSALFAGPGTRLTAGRSYIWRDKLPEGSDARYWLEEIELNGRSIWHGPIFVGDNPPPKAKYLLASNDASDAKTIEDMNTESAEQAPTLPVEEMAQLQMVGNIGPMKADAVSVAAATWTLGSESAVKLSVKREGWYRVTAAELQAAGLAVNAAPKRLQLFVDGLEIPMKVVADENNKLSAIEFYGIGIDTPSTDSHVYWVTVGAQKGKRIETASGNGSATPANSFLYSVERRDRSIYLSGIRNEDKENFFGAVVLSSPVNQVVNLPRVDTAAPGQATIEIAMQGLSLLSHHVSVSLNGNHLGAIDFNAQASKSATFTVPMSSLLEGPNTFTVQGQSTVLDVTLVDRIRVTYLRTYTADSNLLKLTAAGEQKVTVGGFTGADIRVMDVTDPANVSEVQLTPAPGNASTDSVTFSVPGLGNRSLLVFAGDQVRAVAGAVANNKSNLRNNSPKADLVIITHSSLVNSFTPLAALRQAQGLKVAMVDIEDVYDEFSYGNKAPQSVKDFLSFTKSNWRRAPKYVLLAGGASYDPKNYEGQGANDLVPTKLVDTEFMETASDDWFSDFNNDALAEMAMGRLPANNAAEADAMVAKIIGYETSTRSNSVALTSDQNDDFSFEGASDQLKPLVPGTIAKVEIDRGQVGTTVAKQQLLSAIAAGQKIVNYTGHGSSTQWRSSFLTSDDARALTNGSRLPLFVMMTCLNGLFQDANLDGLAPALMKSAKGGAVAVWASSGLTEPAQQSVLNQQLYKLLFPTAGTALNLGDATMKAKAAVTDPDIRRTWILFGDPTTRLK